MPFADSGQRAQASAIAAISSTVAPVPFQQAVVEQESGGRHFAEPAG
jgi:hypothetical protein